MTKKVEAAKSLAKQITLALAQQGQSMSHGVALEVVAKALGARNWHAFQAESEVKAVPAKAVAEWSPAQGPMTPELFVQRRGLRCPVCGNKHYVSGGKLEADEDSAWCDTSCANCGATWTETLGLCGMINLDTGSYTARDRILFALALWLTEDAEDLSGERQEALDEMVCEAACSDNQHLEELNGCIGEDEQEEVIVDAETRASNINNEGLLGQLEFLRDAYDTQDDFINALAKNCKISRDTLKL